MFLDHPIFGVGPRNYGMWLADYYIPYGVKDPANMWGRAAHSLYFTLLPETGLAGTIVVTLMLWNNVKDLKYVGGLERRKAQLIERAGLDGVSAEEVSRKLRSLHVLSLGFGGAFVAFLTTGAFISVLWYGYFWMLTSFVVMTRNAAAKIVVELERLGAGAGHCGEVSTGFGKGP